jgi:hypothetical protein
MSMTFTKLFSSITASTIWAAPDQTRIVWITMLAMADQHGRVWASIPGLANIARVSIEATETALAELMAPDKYSRTTEHEGRRIAPIDGGWRLLNHGKYRAIRDEESIKESKRRYINNRRAAERKAASHAVEDVEQCRTDVDRSRANTEAEAEADTEKSAGGGATSNQGAATEQLPPAFEGQDEFKAQKPSVAGRACLAMRGANIQGVNPSHPDLLRLLAAGVTPEDIGATAAELVAAGKPRNMLYVLRTIEGRRRDAAGKAAVPVTTSTQDKRADEHMQKMQERAQTRSAPPPGLRTRVARGMLLDREDDQ